MDRFIGNKKATKNGGETNTNRAAVCKKDTFLYLPHYNCEGEAADNNFSS